MDQTRRDFCVHTCQAISLAAAASLIEACGGNPAGPTDVVTMPSVNGTVAGNTVTVNVAGSPLATVGNAALLQVSSGKFLLVRAAQDSITALTAICTHQQCTVTGFDNQRFTCPCHGSQYSTTGAVLRGPAPSALRQFATTFVNDTLTI